MDVPNSATELSQALAAYRDGRLREVVERCSRILAHDSANLNAVQLLGVVLHKQRRFAEAEPLLRHAAILAPGMASAHFNVAENLSAQHRPAEAIPFYRVALRLKPDDAIGFNNLGNAFEGVHQLPEALEAYDACLRLRPDYTPAYNNRGVVLFALGQHSAAATAFQTATERDPAQSFYFKNLGNVLKELGRLGEAAACYQRAIALSPASDETNSSWFLCRQYDPTATPDELVQAHRAWGQRLTADIAPLPPVEDPVPAPGISSGTSRPLRVGLVSSDLRRHPVTFFLLPLLSARNRALFHYIAFADIPAPDHYTRAVQDQLDGWVTTTGLTPAQIAARIREQKIDLLIDLSGHAGRSALAAFARRPAPVQLTYLGYPGTTGLPAMDYRLTDALADPPGRTESHYTEELIRLPRCAWCYGPPLESLPVAPPEGISERPVTFGCFNTSSKWNEALFQAWGDMLATLPEARLKLKSLALNDSAFREEVAARLVRAGAKPEQLHLLPASPSIEEHLSHYHDVDVALDTHPYHGTTTTCDALWMGVPVITLAGNAHRERVGVSLLTAAGLADGITHDWKSYVRRAIAWAARGTRGPAERLQLRKQLQGSPLMDRQEFARAFESTLASLWANRANRPAAHHTGSPQATLSP